MPTIILSSAMAKDRLDATVKKKAYAFLEKLRDDDALPGLNVEEIKGSRDSRVRTGRVDDNYRAVLFKLKDTQEPVYVIHGIWPHDEANGIAEKVTLRMNPVNGVPEIRLVLNEAMKSIATGASPVATAATVAEDAGAGEASAEMAGAKYEPAAAADVSLSPAGDDADSRPWSFPFEIEDLQGRLGLDHDVAVAAVRAASEEEFQSVIESVVVEWQELALLALATGSSIEDVRRDFHLDEDVDASGTEDERIVRALGRDAAKAAFHWIEDDEELRRVIETGDFGAWRIFLHPEQRNYVELDWKGPFRLSGGAGTGKTVVAVHRARRLATSSEGARVLLTTYTRNLADDLQVQLRRLDPGVPIASHAGETGVLVRGVDALAWAVIQKAGTSISAATAAVLGSATSSVLKGTTRSSWAAAISEAGADLPKELANPGFFEAEYAMVVLPSRVTTLTGYLRVRRPGRGIALDRARRAAVWAVIEAYRAEARLSDTTDFEEKAAIATEWLRDQREAGKPALFDHVVVDEGQDLTPSRFSFLRALVAEGPNDLFICEDSHQRIYGHKVTLGQCGIRIVGRSRRLTLNYRTTEQNLRWAIGILSGGDFTDLEGHVEEHAYRSARSGPEPHMMSGSGVSEELDHAAALIKSWLPNLNDPEGRASAPESIAILVKDRYRRDTVVNGLAERGVDVRAVDKESVKAGRPVAMTMHRAKGLEFSHVLLFNVQERSPSNDDNEDAKDEALRERSLLYVAGTRARDVLAVSWSGTKLMANSASSAPT